MGGAAEGMLEGAVEVEKGSFFKGALDVNSVVFRAGRDSALLLAIMAADTPTTAAAAAMLIAIPACAVKEEFAMTDEA